MPPESSWIEVNKVLCASSVSSVSLWWAFSSRLTTEAQSSRRSHRGLKPFRELTRWGVAVSTIQAKAVEKIARAAASLGVAEHSLFEVSGLSPEVLIDPDHRIPFSTLVLLYEQAALLTGDDAFGLHVGESVDPKAFDVLGYSVINSPTFGAGLDRMVRYNSLWTNGSAFTVEISPAGTRITSQE